jgi:hypothetical protein
MFLVVVIPDDILPCLTNDPIFFYKFMIVDDHVEQVASNKILVEIQKYLGEIQLFSSIQQSDADIYIEKLKWVVAQDASIRPSDTWHSFY